MTDVRTTVEFPELWWGGRWGYRRPGRVVSGVERFDVVDDDVLDGDDVHRALLAAVDPRGADDLTYARAQVDDDLVVTAGDAVLIARRAARLGAGVEGAMASATVEIDESLRLDLGGAAAWDVDVAAMDVRIGDTVVVSTSRGQIIAVVPQDGSIRVACADAHVGDSVVIVETPGKPSPSLRVRQLRAYDERGGLIPLERPTSVAAIGSSVLRAPYPNPFNPRVVVPIELERSAELWVRILDLRGRVVRTLARGTHSAGSHSLVWHGSDDSGAPVSSGVYRVRATIGSSGHEALITLVR